MKKLSFMSVVLVPAIFAVASTAQEPVVKKFASGGVTFDYAAGWDVTDSDGTDSHQVSLSNKETDSQILIIVLRRRTESKEPMPDLKKQVVEPWLTALIAQYTKQDIIVERSPTTTEAGGQRAEGAKLKFSLDGQAGGSEAYWFLLDKRLVLLYFIRPDKSAEKAASGWDIIRKSIRVEPHGK